MKAGRQPRSDSVTAMISAMENASLPQLRPPKQCKLRKGDRPFWNSIVRARARAEWSEVDLVVAAQLARCQADIEREQSALDIESTVIENARGTSVMNPRVSVLEQLARREMALLRTLRMAGAVAGSAKDASRARSVEADARRARESLEEEDPDELLAR